MCRPWDTAGVSCPLWYAVRRWYSALFAVFFHVWWSKKCVPFPSRRFSGEREVWEFSSWHDGWHPLPSRRDLPGPCEQFRAPSQMQYCTWGCGPRESTAQSFGMRGREAESLGKPTLELCSFLMLESGEKPLAGMAVILPVFVLLKSGQGRAVN